MSITEFLLARIEEDEDAARGVNRGLWNSRVALLDHDLYGHVQRQHPERVLAECEAKRRIVADVDGLSGQWYDEIEDKVLTALALPYAAHPDYREEWQA